MYVPSWLKKTRNNEQLSWEYYNYTNAVFHRTGLGFRGFRKIETEDVVNKRTMTSVFDPELMGAEVMKATPTDTIVRKYVMERAQDKTVLLKLQKETVKSALDGTEKIRSIDHRAGVEQDYFHYTFTGKILKQQHVRTESGNQSVKEVSHYTYDSAERLIKVTHQLNDGKTIVLSANEYDELCRLKKSVLNNDKQPVEYAYNIRNWLTDIKSSLFTQTLHYNEGTGVPYYNGNISSMTWKAGSDPVSKGYKFTYDGLSRMKDAKYGEGNDLSANLEHFNEQVTEYDKMGNMLGLKRYGQISENGHGIIDNLSMTYEGNLLKTVQESAPNSVYANGFEFKDGASLSTEYSYDANGNLTQDLNKKITDIQYNCLNLPGRIEFEDGNSISYLYDANGTKLRTTHIIDGITTTTDYCGNVIYENEVAKTLLTESGYVSLKDGKYHYYLKDHQGNNRIVVDEDGEVEERNDYYPFGGLMASSSGSVQDYKYSGKELDRKGGLDWYDYGARHYDAVLGRFITIDPLAENSYFVNPYTYCLNNPFNRVDPSGLSSHYNWDSQRYEDERGNEVSWESVQQEYGIGKGSRDSNGDDNSPSKPQVDSVVETTPTQNKQKVVKMIPVLGNSFIQDIEYFYFNQHNTVPLPSHPFLDESCRHR